MSLSTKERKILMSELERIIKETRQAHIPALVFELQKAHGFAEKTVMDAIKRFQTVGIVKIEEDVVIWV